MASPMSRQTVDATQWTKIITAKSTILIQNLGPNPASIFVTATGDAAPSGTTTAQELGIVVKADLPNYSRVGQSVDVYARAYSASVSLHVEAE